MTRPTDGLDATSVLEAVCGRSVFPIHTMSNTYAHISVISIHTLVGLRMYQYYLNGDWVVYEGLKAHCIRERLYDYLATL